MARTINAQPAARPNITGAPRLLSPFLTPLCEIYPINCLNYSGFGDCFDTRLFLRAGAVPKLSGDYILDTPQCNW